tara:strand:+ start:896 stop:1837 length:942 start_codon:yes stop_codon:yes gene_type:complete
MKISLIFPGQGSQIVGMGKDFYNSFNTAKETFVKLDDTLNRPLSNLIFSGDEKELSNTVNSQPAIMATSIAIFRSIIEEKEISKDSIQCVAGHSLGEYSALVANGSISVEDSIKLLDVRSRAMQESMPIGTGGMAAIIGKSLDEVNEILSELENYGKIFIANDNADGQVVLSGEIQAINFICENYKNFKIKRAIKLPVSAPFHCNLINSASKKLDNVMSAQKFNEFNFPLYSNVTSEQCNSSNIKELLVKQIVSKVRWRESVENMIRDGINLFIEIGPGSVLTNLIKRINNNVSAISVSNVDDLEKIRLVKKS